MSNIRTSSDSSCLSRRIFSKWRWTSPTRHRWLSQAARRHLCDFVRESSYKCHFCCSTSHHTTSIYIASYYECMLHTVDIRGAFLNTEFTSTDALCFCKSEHIDKLNGRNVSCYLQWLYSAQGLLTIIGVSKCVSWCHSMDLSGRVVRNKSIP